MIRLAEEIDLLIVALRAKASCAANADGSKWTCTPRGDIPPFEVRGRVVQALVAAGYVRYTTIYRRQIELTELGQVDK
jgi:hypothetical protein